LVGVGSKSDTGDCKARFWAYPCSLRLSKVGARGFEPPTSRTRTVRASRSALRPDTSLTGASHYTSDVPSCKVWQRRLPGPMQQNPRRASLLTCERAAPHQEQPHSSDFPTTSSIEPGAHKHGPRVRTDGPRARSHGQRVYAGMGTRARTHGHTCLHLGKVAHLGRLCYTEPHDTSRRFLMYQHRPDRPGEQE
jgi:hypothetical protein